MYLFFSFCHHTVCPTVEGVLSNNYQCVDPWVLEIPASYTARTGLTRPTQELTASRLQDGHTCLWKNSSKTFSLIANDNHSSSLLYFPPLHLFLPSCVSPDVTQRTVTLVTLSEEHAIVSILSPLHPCLAFAFKYVQYIVFHKISVMEGGNPEDASLSDLKSD